MIRIFNLYEYVQPRVTVNQPNQHTIFKCEIEENFPVALYVGGQKGIIRKDEQGFRYDTYISYVDKEPDSSMVWDLLIPRLKEAGIRIAVSGDVEAPGVDRVVSIERGTRQAKRTMIILTKSYLRDRMANFENILEQTRGIQEGTYRLLPVKFGEFDENQLPIRLSKLNIANLVHPHRAEREFHRLIEALKGSVPYREDGI